MRTWMYRLVWHSTQHKPPLYIWRAVPPAQNFVALGMVVSTGEEPPPLTACHCVPRRWCEAVVADRFVWRDDGQGGRAGSLWATPNMDLMLCVRGHEPGEEERTVWCLKEEKCSSDNVGWLVSQ